MASNPRRPAFLYSGQAENIVGVSDFTEQIEKAREIAYALLGQPESELGRAVAAKLPDVEPDVLAELWQDAPDSSLPAALWRLYLLQQWLLRDYQTVLMRYAQGRWADKNGYSLPVMFENDVVERRRQLVGKLEAHAEEIENKFVPAARKEIGTFQEILDQLWQGKLNRFQLVTLLASAANFMTVLATGSSANWLSNPDDELAFAVTLRPSALLQTAEELGFEAELAYREKLV